MPSDWEKFPKLSGSNWAEWEQDMTVHLRVKRLLPYVDGTEPAPDPATATARAIREWQNANAQAYEQLYFYTERGPLRTAITGLDNAERAWNILRRRSANNCPENIMRIRQLILTAKKRPDESFEAYCERIRRLHTQAEAIGMEVNELESVLSLIAGLPKNWNIFKRIEAKNMPRHLTFNEVTFSILAEEQRRLNDNDSED